MSFHEKWTRPISWRALKFLEYELHFVFLLILKKSITLELAGLELHQTTTSTESLFCQIREVTTTVCRLGLAMKSEFNRRRWCTYELIVHYIVSSFLTAEYELPWNGLLGAAIPRQLITACSNCVSISFPCQPSVIREWSRWQSTSLLNVSGILKKKQETYRKK